MMDYQAIFKRYELKYLLTLPQKYAVLRAMEPYMALDEYGRDTVRNIYFDTDSFRLIRHSIEKPAYKEKLRVRSYRQVGTDGTVFVELKKKYLSVVYKRRIALSEGEAMSWLCTPGKEGPDTQIGREIDYFRTFYQTLHPVAFLTYEREAYYEKGGGDFRVTFDENILCRQEALSLGQGVWGERLLEEGLTLMEIKTSGGIPLWMAEVLSREHIYKTSFSKYGTAYQTLIFPNTKGGYLYV